MSSNFRSTFALAVLLTATLGAAEPLLELSGVMTDGEKTRFALTDKSTGQTTWVESGAEHAGYTVASYNPKEEIVTLKKGLEEFPLRLVAVKSTEAGGSSSAIAANTPAPANDQTTLAIRNNLRQLAVAARQHQLETGSATASVADLVGPNKYVKQLSPVDGEDYSGLVFGPGPTNLSVTTANGVTVAVDTAPALGALGSIAAAAGTPDPAATATSTTPAPVSGTTQLTPTGPINTSHVVRQGDTLPKIAEAAGVPLEQLQALNPDVNPGSLKVGQPIRIR